LKRKSNTYKEGNLDFVLAWRSNYCREKITTSKPNTIGNKAEPYKVKPTTHLTVTVRSKHIVL
jgi:hypothetical protein